MQRNCLVFFVAWVFWLLKGAIYHWFFKKGLGNRQGPWGWFKRFWANQGMNKFHFNYTHNGKRHKRVSQGLRQILSNGERYNNSDKLKTKSMVNTGSFWGPESGNHSSTLKFKVLSLSERKFCLCRSCVVCKLNGKRKENTFLWFWNVNPWSVMLFIIHRSRPLLIKTCLDCYYINYQ